MPLQLDTQWWVHLHIIHLQNEPICFVFYRLAFRTEPKFQRLQGCWCFSVCLVVICVHVDAVTIHFLSELCWKGKLGCWDSQRPYSRPRHPLPIHGWCPPGDETSCCLKKASFKLAYTCLSYPCPIHLICLRLAVNAFCCEQSAWSFLSKYCQFQVTFNLFFRAMTRVLLNFLLGCHPVCSWAMSEFWILLSCTYTWFSLISPYSCKVPGPLLQDDISEEIMSDYSLVLYFFIYFVLKFIFYQASFHAQVYL